MTERYKIEVSATTEYLEHESEPERDRYAFAYTITIVNRGLVAAKLISRHWIITDANGHEQQVRGEGVVGEQPRLNPNEGFRYTSGVVLDTPIGAMQGSYQMLAEDGTKFDASIAPFSLANRRLVH
ncbi:MAG: Co2+/Mg2+ efflux protein ApaG [Thiofilum sp.]|uniref:Co2+/Mg2+ efflux protein ApaG n=1 Tax=Thiofilum sp. TaxID=2212733 RepID=UPI0025EB1CE7|nr:Co2+/Mg2+ efflux protein ApaG [Thiofilum sp.]MBK8452584.1 Co2+/Mg2+ efflux protein ApaG [Thiofilum sp.]